MSKYLTKEGFEKLKKELEYLQNTKRREVSEKIRHTASHGDLKENAGYAAAKDEQGFVEGRIRELREIVNQAKIIEKREGANVQMGSFVLLNSTEGDEKFQIVGPEEADIFNNKISFESPLGKELLNRGQGETITVDTPSGEKKYKILSIE